MERLEASDIETAVLILQVENYWSLDLRQLSIPIGIGTVGTHSSYSSWNYSGAVRPCASSAESSF